MLKFQSNPKTTTIKFIPLLEISKQQNTKPSKLSKPLLFTCKFPIPKPAYYFRCEKRKSVLRLFPERKARKNIIKPKVLLRGVEIRNY